jgi:hypothetical protein
VNGINSDFRDEIRSLTRKCEHLTGETLRLFGRVRAAQQVFGAVMAGRPVDQHVDLADKLEIHDLYVQLDAFAQTFTVLDGDEGQR